MTRPPAIRDGVGDSAMRPDGTLKVTGEFAYASDLWMDDMLWGVTLRSPHPYARIRGVDLGPALATPGVYAVLTAEDIPGRNRVGLEHEDQPALADGVVQRLAQLDTQRRAADAQPANPISAPPTATPPGNAQ